MSWKDLNEFIYLAHTSSDGSIAFTARYPSNSEARQELMRKLVESVVDSMEVEVEKRLASIPKPDASTAEWKQVGVADDALFADELLASCKCLDQTESSYPLDDPPFEDYNRRETWESLSSRSTHKAMALILHALAETSDPFEHLPAFVYLAHHARVPLSLVLDVTVRLHSSPHSSPYRDIRFPYGSALEQYILLTMSQYLFMNIIEEIDQGQACLADGLARKMLHLGNSVCILDERVLNDEYPDGEPVSPWLTMSPAPSNEWFRNQRDSVHNGFWKAQEDSDRKEVNVEARDAYKRRCFDMLVSWYTTMKASSLKNDAIDCGLPPFTKNELTVLLLDVLTSFQYPFALNPIPDAIAPDSPQVEAVQEELEKLTLLEPTMGCEESSPPTRPSQIASSFLWLPSEIHFHIHSFLSSRSLLSLSTVCLLMRQHCLRTLYNNPFDLAHHGFDLSSSTFRQTNSTFFTRIIKLQKLLLVRPELRQYIRSLTVRASPLQQRYKYRHSWNYELPLLSTLAKHVPNLTKLTVGLAYTGETLDMHQAGDFGSKAAKESRRLSNILRYISQQYSQLSSLSLSFESWDSDMLSVVDTSYWHESPRIHDPDVFPSWSLQDVSIFSPMRWNYRNDNIPGVDSPTSIPIAPILRSSANSLRTLYVRAYRDDIGTVSAFPVFTSVTDLSLYVDMSPPEVQELLHRSFPVLEDLLLSADDCIVGDDYTMFSSIPLDFSFSSPKLTAIEICKYRIERLPTKTTQVSVVYLDLMESEAIGVASEDVLAVSVTDDYHSTPDDSNMDVIRKVSLAFPALRTLNLAHGYTHFAYTGVVVVADLLTFVSELKDTLPLLEALLLTVQYFIIRPKRRDYPVDDGIDEIECEYAVKIFKIYPNLKILSLTGTPSDFEDFPTRKQHVWVRETCEKDEVGARLVENPGSVHFPGYGYYVT